MTQTHREIRQRTIAAGDARTALLRRRYDEPIEDVWHACTDPDRISRWLARVTGDLRLGGSFSLENNASGEILRCEPPRLLIVTWAFGNRPVDEVELRLEPDADGGTVLEIEHATVTGTVQWEGRQVDAIPGVGVGWELRLTHSLTMYLRGELPDSPVADWHEVTRGHEELLDRSGKAWAALVG